MFHDVAIELIKMMGASGRVPSALSAEEVPAAIKRLRGALHHMPSVGPEDEEEEDQQQPAIGLPTRAVPLLDLLERAAAKNAEVLWEVR